MLQENLQVKIIRRFRRLHDSLGWIYFMQTKKEASFGKWVWTLPPNGWQWYEIQSVSSGACPDKVLNHKRKAWEGKLMGKAYLYTFSNWTVDALAERLRQLWKMNDDFILMELLKSSCKAGITYTYQTTEIESRSGWGPLRIEQHFLLFLCKIKCNGEKISL